MILPEFIDVLLLGSILFCPNDLIHPPFVAGSCAEHASHQMVVTVCMCKGMERIVFIHAEFIGSDEDRTARTQGDVASAVADGACPHSCGSIIARTGCHLYIMRDTQFICDLALYAPYRFIAFKDLRELFALYAADIHHFL